LGGEVSFLYYKKKGVGGKDGPEKEEAFWDGFDGTKRRSRKIGAMGAGKKNGNPRRD